jgi:hypothetical protein
MTNEQEPAEKASMNTIQEQCVSALDAENSTRFAQIMLVLSSDKTLGLQNKLLRHYLLDDDLPYHLRRELAERFPRSEASRLWNWRWLEGDYLYRWAMSSPLDDLAFDMVIKNHSFTLDKMTLMFRGQKGVRRTTYDLLGDRRRTPRDTYAFRDGLLAYSSKHSLQDFEIPKVLVMLQTFELSITALTPRLRAIHDIDDSIPDSWVEKMFAA